MSDLAAELFAQALRLPPGDREPFVRAGARGDESVARRVHAMLRSFEAVHATVPETMAVDLGAPTVQPVASLATTHAGGAGGTRASAAPTAEFTVDADGPVPFDLPTSPTPTQPPQGGLIEDLVGQTIGPYKILQEIGEGGFGAVYMAQQLAPIKRKVAIKIVKPGMDTRQVIGRFEAERQALAMMDHPNIAKVLDAGATPHGRPYFVMELVKGVPITEYCDTNNLTTQQRLELFQTVCQAVLHAHQKGIIHRDLKPSNVMVTLHDGEPVPKVIDFGIAKATGGQDLTDKTVFTEYRHFIGTPEYMSPEQAAMSGLDVDTRSDIYSLGVLLYELLTGTTPLNPAKLRSRGYAEIQRIIADSEPPRPSTRVSETASKKEMMVAGDGRSSTAEQVARHRRTDVASLRRQLSGDLDWIVMKAIEKDRTRRYPTCGALVEDIRRFLGNEPIMARPPSTAYKVRKFARRNRAILATGGAVLSALVLALAALAYGYVQVSHERDTTAERETVARAEMLLSTMNSVRSYTTTKVRPALNNAFDTAHGVKLGAAGAGTPTTAPATSSPYPQAAPFVPESVPAFAANQVFESFRKDERYATFNYKEASLNPTNRLHMANEFEAGILRRFSSPDAPKEITGVLETAGGKQFYIARPMKVTAKSCLDCHTTPELAPPQQVALYGREGGYGWKMDEVIAAQMVYVPVSDAFRADPTRTYWVIGSLAGVFVLASGGLALVLRKA
jgi:serine/threonine protein kinase